MSKKIKCYNCGRVCEVTKCSCGAEDWQCECGYGSGHIQSVCMSGENIKNLRQSTNIDTYEEENTQLKKQLAEKENTLSIKSVIKTLMKHNNLNCSFRDKTNAQIQQCGDVYNSNYGYFNFEEDYDESLHNKNDSRFDIISIDLAQQDKISFSVEQLEQVKEFTEKEIKECSKLLQEEFEDDLYSISKC